MPTSFFRAVAFKAGLFLLLFTLTKSLPAQKQTGELLVIKSSTVLDELAEKKKQNPNISAAALSAFGNDLLKLKGYNFTTYTCDIAEINKIGDNDSSDQPVEFTFDLTQLTGKSSKFRLTADDWGYPCGCAFDLTVLKADSTEMTVLANNRPIRVKRPAFYFEEVELVDKSLKKTLRKWYKPTDIQVYGISADGLKIYVETNYDNKDNKLLLEISENGTFRFVPKDSANILKNGVGLTDFPRDKENDYLGYTEFKAKGKSFILKFSGPCT